MIGFLWEHIWCSLWELYGGYFLPVGGFAALGERIYSSPISDSSHQGAYFVPPARVAKVKAWHEVLEVNADAELGPG